MTFATATAIRGEAVALSIAAEKLVIGLREIYSGQGTVAAPGRETTASLDVLVAATTAAITAVNA